MYFIILLLGSLAVTSAKQSYEIKLYTRSDCWFFSGKKCSCLSDGQCCWDSTQDFKSAKLTANGDSTTKDQIWLYDGPCSGIPLKEQKGYNCVTYTDQPIMGAAVAVGYTKRDASKPVELVEPDEAFLEEGNFVYTIKRNSTAWEAYERLARDEDQIAHLRAFGKREVISE